MEKSSFFNSMNGDRKYKAETWAAYFGSFIGNGVFPAPPMGLQVTAGSGLSVTVTGGRAWINGYFYINTGDLTLTLPVADGVLKRIDRVVIQWNLTARTITTVIKSSAPSQNPTPPPLERDADIYELCLGDVLINAGATGITQANITDQRLNADLCGIVVGLIQQIDTSQFYGQLSAFFTDIQLQAQTQYNSVVSFFDARKLQGDAELAALKTWFNQYKLSSEAEFYNWFENLQTILDENAITNITNILQNHGDRITLLEAVVFNDISSNPFVITFDTLSGVDVTGVWNSVLQRIEC